MDKPNVVVVGYGFAGRCFPAEMTVQTIPGRWRSYYENIAATLRGEAEPAVTPQSVRAALAVIQAARQSAATGQAVRLDEVRGA